MTVLERAGIALGILLLVVVPTALHGWPTTLRGNVFTLLVLAAGLALIPLALSGGKSGSEIQTPMAIVILCGLATSTLLNMFVVPTLYLRYGRPVGASTFE